MFISYGKVKRALDILIGAIALILLLPLIAVIALLVWLKLGAPILFAQNRPGKDGRPFTLYKFRTMKPILVGAPEETDEERLTPFGKWLRSTSLDELPELWNVILGDMSIVGPRPLLMEYLPLYSAEQARRHEVRPGITGWAQVNGRNAISWDEKFALDVWYAENLSFALDIKILLLTAGVVFSRNGINSDNSESVEKFKG